MPAAGESLVVRDAASPADLETVRALFRDYQAWLGVDLCFQGFEHELATLPGRYAPPAGRLLLAETANGAAAGCVGLWALDDGVCEMKRLWVQPAWRRGGLGRRLAETIVATGAAAGYHAMRLDSLRRLRPALALYRSLGFVEIEPYYANPLDDVIYLERSLR